MFQIGEIVGIAQEIKGDEMSAKQSIEQVSIEIDSLEQDKYDLERERDDLEDALDEAYDDIDEDGEPDRGRIAALQARIAHVNQQISYVESNISQKNFECQSYRKQLENTENKKERIIYEIEERARKTSNNIHVSGGRYGAFSGVCTTLQASLQSNMDTLSEAAGILGTNLASYSTSVGNGGDAHQEVGNDSFMAGLKSAVVSDEEAVTSRNNDSDSSSNNASDSDDIPLIQRDRPIYDSDELEHENLSGVINKIRQKIENCYKWSNDEFIEITNDNTSNAEKADVKSELKSMVNEGLPINPSFSYKSSGDEDDDIMSNEPDFSRKQGESRDIDEIERMSGLECFVSKSYDISKVKGITLKVGEKDVYEIEVVKDRFIPQKDITPLFETKQRIRSVIYTADNIRARIFDHPENLLYELPYRQGNNERGMSGTCGLANLGVWLKIAGSAFSEKDVVNCACTNIHSEGKFLCSKEGGTAVEWRAQLWSMFGMDANVYKRGTMPDNVLIDRIAAAVETGRAVSVGLNAGQLWSRDNLEEYDYGGGEDSAFGDGGSNHVVGIVSCVRDIDTGEITHLYINDTGRGLERDACRKVAIEDFKKAFCVKRASVCISQYAIW